MQSRVNTTGASSDDVVRRVDAKPWYPVDDRDQRGDDHQRPEAPLPIVLISVASARVQGRVGRPHR